MTIYEALQAIRERADKATPGPWQPKRWDVGVSIVLARHALGWTTVCGEIAPENAEFIAHARTDVPKLLDALTAVMNLVDSTSVVYIPDLRHVIAKALNEDKEF